MSQADILQSIYNRLIRRFGPQHWWPGRTRFEIIVGAILTQNTNWTNVEKAIANLRKTGLLSPAGLRKIPSAKLAALIRPSGYFNIKTKRLKHFIDFLFEEYGGDLRKMAAQPAASLRKKILAVNGIGPETADSILLYAFNKPVFVVDAYTKRVLYRHGLVEHDADYHNIQDIFKEQLPEDSKLFNEYHALIVRVGKEFCKPTPRCELCPLRKVRYSIPDRCGRCFRGFGHDSRRAHARVCPVR